jgi:hypothetical protein
MPDERERGFTVSDRRRFSPETGDARAEGAEDRQDARASRGTHPSGTTESAAAATAHGGPDHPSPPAVEDEDLPEITLSTFIMSMSTQVLMHLGEIPNPIDNTVRRDMVAAKQVIDILGMLKDKTRGNLERNEEVLFDNVLYDLRMRFVELNKPRANR